MAQSNTLAEPSALLALWHRVILRIHSEKALSINRQCRVLMSGNRPLSGNPTRHLTSTETDNFRVDTPNVGFVRSDVGIEITAFSHFPHWGTLRIRQKKG